VNEKSAGLREILAKASRKLAAAQRDLEARDWEDAVSRAYFGAFHAITAVLHERGLSFSSHAQTLGAFNRECVRSGEFPSDFTRKLDRLMKDRQYGDYSITIQPSEETARRAVKDAEEVVTACRRFLENRMRESS
jgi:uncharacterized protein (UPF0332 family)